MQAFFSKEYVTENPNDQPLITELKELIVEQVGAIRDIKEKTMLNALYEEFIIGKFSIAPS